MDTQDFDFDLFVIGAGSGGVRASRIAASLGARAAVCEERYLGGTCVNVGCVPKKLFVYGSHFREDAEDAAGFGWQVTPPGFEWSTLIANKDAEITRLNGIYGGILERAGVTVVNGRGRVLGPHEVAVGDTRFSARHILIATGSWPLRAPIPGGEHMVTSNELFYLDDLPERAVVVGGGYIGTEMAAILHGFGARVSLVHRADLLLPRYFDRDVRAFLTAQLTGKGLDLHLERVAIGVEARDGAYVVELSDGQRLEADVVLCACGRRPLTDDLGLEQAGVKLDEWGALPVDAEFRSNVPSIYGVGDVIGGPQLTPIALAEGRRLAHNLFGPDEPRPLAYDNIPTAVFTQPPVGTVGLSEAQARKKLGAVRVFKSEFRPMKHTMTGRGTRTLMKLVVDADTDRVVGCHMVGDDAGEIVQGLAVALNAGATKAQFDQTLGIHPTAAEEFVTMRTPVG